MVKGHGLRSPPMDGFTYLGLLIVIALLGIGLVATSEVWVTSAHRQKAEELEWIGAQFTQAIGSYYESSPGGAKVYPSSLQELLEDRRYVTMRRHLRTIYANPFTGKPDWELVKAADSRVRGVRTLYMTQAGSKVMEFVYRPDLGEMTRPSVPAAGESQGRALHAATSSTTRRSIP